MERPIQEVPVPKYRPNPTDFYATLDHILSKAKSLRISEPNVCNQLKDRIEETLKKYNGFVNEDREKIEKTFEKSNSDKLDEAKNIVKTANDTVTKEFQTLFDNFSKTILEKCRDLGSDDPLKKINQAVSELQTKQQDVAKQLTDLPAQYIENMQSHYVPIEKINI